MSAINKAIGISQEGFSIKTAVLSIDKGFITIKDLQMATVRTSEVNPTDNVAAPLENVLENLDFDFEFGDTGESRLYEKEEEETPSYPEPVKKDFSEILAHTEAEKTLDDLAGELHFETGTLSLNLDFANVTYKEIKIPAKKRKKKLLAEIRKIFYENDRPIVSTLSYLTKKDGSIVGISHEKNMELLEQIILINRSISKKRYHYSYVQPNEVVLLNALRFNYVINDDDISAIIHISKDHTQVLMAKGYDFLVDLPLINEGSQAKDIIRTTISRIMLERNQLGISSIQNYFLAGEGLTDAMLNTIKDREPDAQVQFLLPVRIAEQEDYSHMYDDATLAEYIIPIMLAVVSLLPKNTFLIRTTFLPKQLKEQQNILSISRVGFLILGTILITTLISINMTLRDQTANNSLRLENTNLTHQIRVQQTLLDSVYTITSQIEEIEKNIGRTQTLLGSKNQWHFIVGQLSETFRAKPLVWLSSLKNEKDGLRISGKTNNRLNIIEISEIFPDAVIHYVTENEIEGNRVWHFEISFKYPNALETKRYNFQREGINVLN